MNSFNRAENKIKIIIVEDDDSVSNLLCSVVYNIQWLEVVVASSAKEFWELYKYGEIGGIILDLNLGTGINDGFTLAEKLRSIDNNIFIFVITGYSEAIQNSKLLESGVDDFLLKPFEIQILRSRLFLMFSRLRRWENMRKLYDVNSKQYEEKLNQLKLLFDNIKKRLNKEGGDNLIKRKELCNVNGEERKQLATL